MKQRLPVAWFCALLFCLSCTKDYSYEGGLVSSGYVVKDNSGACSFTQIEGDYKTEVSLDENNFLKVLIHVDQQGRYVISSDSVNGYSFSASGNFVDTGTIQVKLYASGKPVAAGTNVFTITYASSSCQATVTVQDTASNPDHFPLTVGSRWVYDDLTFPGDSIITTVLGDTLIGTIAYKGIGEYKSFYPATNRRYYAKSGTDYFRYTSVSGFTSAFNYSPSLYDDFNFLKEGLTNGFTWQSKTYRGRTSLGIEEKLLRYSFTCLDVDASLTVNNRLFTHVYKIQMIPEEAEPDRPLVRTGEVHTLYYAKGIGLIYQEFYNGVLPHPVLAIRRWVVN